MAFTMRERRYSLEESIKNEQREIESLRKDIENTAKVAKIVEGQFRENQGELEAFVLEKQRRLNGIDATVVLKYHQLQHIQEPGNVPGIHDCLLFGRMRLSELYRRIGELQTETLDLREKRKKNRAHLRRLGQDCEYMEAQRRKVQQEIKEETVRKFGRPISLISLYESTLQQMIYEAKADARLAINQFDRRIKGIRRDCGEKLVVLEDAIRDNTEKLSILAVLEQEKSMLRKILAQAPNSREDSVPTQEEIESCRRDLVNLEQILGDQAERKRLLENDIRNLRMKSGRLPPICLKRNSVETLDAL